MELVKLVIARLENTGTGTGAFLLHLKEKDAENPRILPIVIGAFEAQAIIFGLEKDINPPRPLTHDLFHHVLTGLGYQLEKIIISKLHEGIFYSTLYITDGKKTYEFDSRTSDAVALAVRFKAPIYTTKEIMDEAGVIIRQKPLEHIDEITEEIQKALDELLPEDEKGQFSIGEDFLEKIKSLMKEFFGAEFEISTDSKEDLEKLLQKAIENEDYELAAKIRDLINELSKNDAGDENEE